MGKRSAAALCTVVLALTAAPAQAQEQKAASVSAFDEAERLMAEGKVSEACRKYAESQRLDPQLGTLLHLADCFEKNGQTASAWASFREATELAEKRQDARGELANQRAAALVPKLSKLQIDVPAGSEAAHVQVKRDNVVVGSALWGAPVPTDPGAHVISVSAPGRRPWTGNAVVKADGSITIVEVPELEAEVPASPEATASGPTTNKVQGPQPTDPKSAAPEAQPGLADRWPALTAGAVGLVGVGVGSAFGLRSISKGDDAKQYCTGNSCSDRRGVTLKQEALDAGNVSTAAFIVGGVGLAAGVVLWFVVKPSPRTQTGSLRVGVERGQLRMEQSW